MSRRRNLLLAGGSVLLALGAGQYLQSGSARYAAAQAFPAEAGTSARSVGSLAQATAFRSATTTSGDRSTSSTAAPTEHADIGGGITPSLSRFASASGDSADKAVFQSVVTAAKPTPDAAMARTIDISDAVPTATRALAASTEGSSDTDPLALGHAPSAIGMSNAAAFAKASDPMGTASLVTRDSHSPATLSPAGDGEIALASALVTDSLAGPQVPTSAPSAATPAAFTAPDAPTTPDGTASSEACPVTLDLFADRDATLALTLTAPCRPNEGVVLRHAGMAVTYQTTATGSLFLDIPALDAAGDVTIRFQDGAEVTGAAPVPELATLRRFALQWVDGDSFSLVTDASVTTLGTAATVLPMFAQVATLPDPATPLSIETEITDLTCGREALATAFYSEGGKIRSLDLALAMPDCDGEGGYVVLNNPVADMKLAAAE